VVGRIYFCQDKFALSVGLARRRRVEFYRAAFCLRMHTDLSHLGLAFAGQARGSVAGKKRCQC
jgi:hypothetical protein